MRRLLVILLSCLPLMAADIIPASRRVAWSADQCGVIGGLLTNRTTHATITATGDTTDRTAAIQNAINACTVGQAVVLGAGDFYITDLELNKGISLRGAGMHATRLIGTGGGGHVIKFGTGSHDYDFTEQTVYNISSGYTKDSTTVTMATTPAAWTAGKIVLFSELEDDTNVDKDGWSGDCSWCGLAGGTRCRAQMVEITGISGNDVMFRPPIDRDFTAGLSPQGVESSSMLRLAGLESLTVTNSAGATDTIVMEGCFKSWIWNCDIQISHRRHIWIYNSMNCEFRHTVFRDGNGADWSSAYGSNRGYGFLMAINNTAHVIEDCVFHRLSFPIAIEGANTWHYIGANLFTNIMNGTVHDPKPSIGGHGAHPQFILIEGNVGGKMSWDFYWGSSSHITTFRNRLIMAPTQNGTVPTQYVIDWDVMKKNYYHNFVGNVLGRDAFENVFDVPDDSSVNESSSIKAIRRLGAEADANDTDYQSYDTQVEATHIYHRNYDTVNDAIVDDGGIAETNLVSSYYHSTTPSFYGGLSFPSISPTGPKLDEGEAAQTIPAGWWFYGQSVPGEIGAATVNVTELRIGTIQVAP